MTENKDKEIIWENIVVTHMDTMSSVFDKLKHERIGKVKLSYYEQNEERSSIKQFFRSTPWWPSNTEYMLGLSKRARELEKEIDKTIGLEAAWVESFIYAILTMRGIKEHPSNYHIVEHPMSMQKVLIHN